MAIKHEQIKPLRGAGAANTPSDSYILGGDDPIKAGAPVVVEKVGLLGFGCSTGKVVELGYSGEAENVGSLLLVGFACHDAEPGDLLRVTPALPGQRFIASLGFDDDDSFDSGHELDPTDKLHDGTDGSPFVLSKDTNLGDWYIDANGDFSPPVQVIVVKLHDPDGATTDDAPSFGAKQAERRQNSGRALVEFMVAADSTIYSLTSAELF